MCHSLLVGVHLCLMLVYSAISSPSSVILRQSSDKYVVIGSHTFSGGVGNTLIYYPSVFFFAIATKREVLISDQSDLGLMCKLIVCGFRRLSQVQVKTTGHGTSVGKDVPTYKHFHLLRHFEGSEIQEQFVRFDSYNPKSDWIAGLETSNGTASVVAMVSGCALADVTCAERFALRSLFVGPLHESIDEVLVTQRNGSFDVLEWERAIAQLTWENVPRIDAAIHLRNQFKHFERRVELSDPAYRQEVSDWLASEEKKVLFEMLGRKLVEELTATDYCGGNGGAGTYTVFIAGDNDEVKQALKRYVEANVSLPIAVLITNSTTGLMHIGSAKHTHSPSVMRSLSLDWYPDWYIISLCNVVIGWRIRGSRLQSTFLHSAQRMGVMRCEHKEGMTTMGSRGLSLQERKAGLHWSPMFQYGTVDLLSRRSD